MVTVGLRDILVLFLSIVVHLFYRFRKRHLLLLPPGPTRWPIIGSALSMTLNYPHISYKQLGDKLRAKVLYYEVLGQPIIVINDVQVAHDLLEKRSAIYSDRPQIRILSEGLGIGKFLAFMSYGDEWRKDRRMFQQYFGPKRINRRLERDDRMLRFVRRGLLPNLLTSPEDFREHMKNCIGGLSLSVTYGLPVERQNDPRVHFSGSVFEEAVAAIGPGKLLTNFISSMCQDIPEWMPGAGFQTAARQLRLRIKQLVEEPCQALLDRGNVEESFVATYLEKNCHNTNPKDRVSDIEYTAGMVFGAAAETTTAAALTFILNMLQNMNVQREAQRELDSVIGPDRMPTMEDIPQLPYLSAVIRETMRWNPIAPLGAPHYTTSDDVYGRYYIPKGSVIITNIYAMLYDEVTYPKPNVFDPDRFLRNGTLRDDVPNPETVASFGFGRRICPGSHIALPFIYLIAASVLHLFDISPEMDAEGNPIKVVPKFAPSSATSEPAPFPCKITPRRCKDVTGLLGEYLDDGPI